MQRSKKKHKLIVFTVYQSQIAKLIRHMLVSMLLEILQEKSIHSFDIRQFLTIDPFT